MDAQPKEPETVELDLAALDAPGGRERTAPRAGDPENEDDLDEEDDDLDDEDEEDDVDEDDDDDDDDEGDFEEDDDDDDLEDDDDPDEDMTRGAATRLPPD